MFDYEPFVRAIRENPDDDGVRLVMADWLDDVGEADLAAFIRSDIELARAPGCSQFMYDCGESNFYGTPLACPACQTHHQLAARRNDLVVRVAPHHFRVHPYLPMFPLGDEAPRQELPRRWATIRRGFIEELVVNPDEWARHGLEILGRHPVREVTVAPDNYLFDLRATARSFAVQYPGVAFTARGQGGLCDMTYRVAPATTSEATAG